MRRPELIELLEGVRSRGQVKSLGGRVEAEPELRQAMEALAHARGTLIESDWSGKRLVRALLNREEGSRIRTNPIHRDESFVCCFCGHRVEPGGARVRDHCPRCLRGLHVDRSPGDRAADCGGVLQPIELSLEGRAGVVVHYRCESCGALWRGRAHPDDAVPPSLDVVDLPPRKPGPEPISATEERARTLPLRVLDQIRSHRLWEPGDRVLIAVSGGMDSTVLMEILVQISGGHGARLEVASVDHGLRPESVSEVAMVGRRARELGLVFHGPCLELSAGSNLQARAREARRGALLAIGCDRIALAHHRNDQAETVLYHLLRGSGAQGLRGMRGLDIPWTRPLLEEPRSVLHAWAISTGLRWFEDPSNPSSQRGRIRELMPLLDTIHGGSQAALSRSARLLSREDDFLQAAAREQWEDLAQEEGIELAALQALHPALCLRVIRILVEPCPHPIRADQLEPILLWRPQGGARIDLGSGWILCYERGLLRVVPPI